MKISHLLTICFLTTLISCKKSSGEKYSKAEKTIINYLSKQISKDDFYEPLTFGKLDTVFVTDTLSDYISHLNNELIYDSLIYLQSRKNRDQYELNPYSEKLLINCLEVLKFLSVKIKLEQQEQDSLRVAIANISDKKIAHYQLSHHYKYHPSKKPKNVTFTLDTSFKILEEYLFENVKGENSQVTIIQKTFYDGESQRQCYGRLISKLRFNGKLVPLNKRYTIKVMPDSYWFSWQLPSFSDEFRNKKDAILIQPKRHYTFVNTQSGIYLKSNVAIK